MSIEKQDILKVAELAKIHIEDDILPAVVDDVSAIIDFVQQIQMVDTDNIEPMANPISAAQPLRADEVTEQDHSKQAAALSANFASQLYNVPKVID